VEAHLEIIKNKGAFAVHHEKIQELSESAQKVGLHLKTCCAVLEGGRLNPEQFKQCLDKVSAYDKQIVFITQQVTEAEQAREQGATDVVQNKIANIDQAIQTATNTAENFVRQVEQIRPPETAQEPAIGKGRTISSETEPNNTAAQATELRLSGEIIGEVSTREDPDYYKLVTTKQLRDRVKLKLHNLSESLRPSLTLYNQNKSKMKAEYDHTYGADIELWFTAESGTYYFVQVSPWDSTGKYKLIAEHQNAHDAFEPNDNAEMATTLSPEKALTANIMDEQDPDWYKFRAPGATVRVRLQNRSTTLRPSVTIYDENRSKILTKYDSTHGSSLDFTFDSTPGKEYFIHVAPWDTLGSYQLTVN